MILTYDEILEKVLDNKIVISNFNLDFLGPNSYDVHLGDCLATYEDLVLDAKKEHNLNYFKIGSEGFVLEPNTFYLGVTKEYTEVHDCVPFLEGKSSTGRLGIDIHATAGKGDIGFCNYWTLEISVKIPVRVYPGMPIGQLIFFKVNEDKISLKYNERENSKYNELNNLPVASKMYKNFHE